MKRLLTFLLLLIASAAMAQPALDKVATNKVTKMDEVVKLTPEQKEKMKPIYAEQTKKAWAANELEKGSQERKDALKANNQSFNQAMVKVLTPEQVTTWRTYIKEQYQKK